MTPRPFPAKSLSFVVGMLSLSAETLWVRTATYYGQSTPKAFAIAQLPSAAGQQLIA